MSLSHLRPISKEYYNYYDITITPSLNHICHSVWIIHPVYGSASENHFIASAMLQFV